MHEENDSAPPDSAPAGKLRSFFDYMIGIARTVEGWFGGIIVSLPIYGALRLLGFGERQAILFAVAGFLVGGGFTQFLKERRRAERAERTGVQYDFTHCIMTSRKDEISAFVRLCVYNGSSRRAMLSGFRLSVKYAYAPLVTSNAIRTPRAQILGVEGAVWPLGPTDFHYDSQCDPIPLETGIYPRWIHFVFYSQPQEMLTNPLAELVLLFEDQSRRTHEVCKRHGHKSTHRILY